MWCELYIPAATFVGVGCGVLIRLATKHCAHVNIHTPVLQPPNSHTRVVVCT